MGHGLDKVVARLGRPSNLGGSEDELGQSNYSKRVAERRCYRLEQEIFLVVKEEESWKVSERK